MKKFLMVVMAMLLSLSVVAGCGGGDKKAELIKGLKTEIGTLLEAALDAVIDETVPNEHEALLDYVRQRRP